MASLPVISTDCDLLTQSLADVLACVADAAGNTPADYPGPGWQGEPTWHHAYRPYRVRVIEAPPVEAPPVDLDAYEVIRADEPEAPSGPEVEPTDAGEPAEVELTDEDCRALHGNDHDQQFDPGCIEFEAQPAAEYWDAEHSREVEPWDQAEINWALTRRVAVGEGVAL